VLFKRISAEWLMAQPAPAMAAVLGTGGGEDTAHLADQRALHPQPPGLVEEVTYLGAHVAEARGRAEDDRVGLSQLVRHRHRDVGERLAGGLGPGPLQCLCGD
jgi:hypothetical protein